MSIPVKVNWEILFDPNGYFFSSWSSTLRNLSFPAHNPSSTWSPRIPSGCPLLKSLRMNKHGSNGDCWNPKPKSSSRIAWNHINGASTKPYAPFSSLQISWGDNPIILIISGTGSMARIRSFWFFPCKNAALISKDLSDHPFDAINWSRSILECLPSVGESRGTSSILGSRYSPSFYRSAKKKNIFHVNEMDDSEVYFYVSCIGGG